MNPYMAKVETIQSTLTRRQWWFSKKSIIAASMIVRVLVCIRFLI